jgi:hypothetical protein
VIQFSLGLLQARRIFSKGKIEICKPDPDNPKQRNLWPWWTFVRLFPTEKDRMAFSKTEESRQIDALIDS